MKLIRDFKGRRLLQNVETRIRCYPPVDSSTGRILQGQQTYTHKYFTMTLNVYTSLNYANEKPQINQAPISTAFLNIPSLLIVQ